MSSFFKPIFIVGNSRSGTTMMSRVLGKHSEIFSFRELHFFEQMASSAQLLHQVDLEEESLRILGRLISIQRKGFFAFHAPKEFKEEAAQLLKGCERPQNITELFKTFLKYETLKNGKIYPCEHTPRNVFYLTEIYSAYPYAHVINMIRDPRDVLLSQKNKWRRRLLGGSQIPLREAVRSWINYHPIIIAKLWNSSVGAASKFEQDDRMKTVRFEDLIRNPTQEVREVCHFLNIKFDHRMLKVPQVGSSLGNDKPSCIGIDQTRTGQWKKGGLTDNEVVVCQKITAKQMKKKNYEIISDRIDTLKMFFLIAAFPVKLVLAFFVNISRMRNIGETIRRRLM